MLLRPLCGLALLVISHGVLAADVRIAVPKAYLDDAFLKSLLASKDLAATGVKLTPLPTESQGQAMKAVMSGAAELGVFTLAGNDQRALEKAGPEASLLTRPFLFKSAEEVSLMQGTFLGEAAMADAGRSGLFPLKLWNHGVTYFLTKTPIRTETDFNKLTLAARNDAPDVKTLSAMGATVAKAPASGAMQSMMEGPVSGFETQLDAATQAFAAKYGEKLYLTTGWPQTGILTAAPRYWLGLSEAEKSAWKIAVNAAAAAADADLMAREDSIRQKPNIELTALGHSTQMQLATRAAGGGAPALESEMGLWDKAAIEVHRPAAPVPAPKTAAAPAKPIPSPVLFVTDRNDEQTLDYATRFGSRRLDPFELTCGLLGAPARGNGETPLPPAPKMLTKGEEDCVRLIVDKVRASGASKILFLIHGFNTSFWDVATRALMLGGDLDYDGAIVAWSWPSEGSAFGYAYDEDSNTWSEPHFADLVRDIAEAAPDLQLDFVAHSMGNRILLQMLREFGQSRANLHIGAAIFAAPDVAQDIFKEQIRLARKVATIRTLYASEYDHAILISESYHSAPRAGSGGANILVTNGVESIDARLSGHSYLFDETKAMNDFKQIINEATKAASRGLEAHAKGQATYWVIGP